MRGISIEITLLLVLLAFVVSIVALLITGFGVTIEWKSIRITRGIQDWLMHESEARPSFVEELDVYLTEEDAEGNTRLGTIGGVVGASLYSSLKGSKMQEASVDSRAFNKYNSKIQDAVKKQMPIGYKVLFKIADKLGFDLEEIMEAGELTQFVDAAKKNRLDLLMGSGANPSSEGVM